MFKDNLVGAVHKDNSPADKDIEYRNLWLSDEARPWDTYSASSPGQVMTLASIDPILTRPKNEPGRTC